ncbi:lipase 1-like [Ostrinia furnacalis]|uniref:lipase 1-like n=1 Tax=Ostrinia furnacalis TaxID=93504 RepID=UPI00103A76F2|nr:lipase 1-like [Ostrinia furnacalis]
MVLSKVGIVAFMILFNVDSVFNNVMSSHIDKMKSEWDSDVFLDSFGLLTKYGYAPERISVTTEDGYVIDTFHIPRSGPPVLLVHGITDSSDEWLVLGPNRSLAYQLADAGLDVWLYNSRGNRYSREHRDNIPKKEYWNFTYEEMGTQDLPAVIDHILNVTSQEKLSYIGFSQGTTIFFVMCSMKPDYNTKIEVSILLAPVAWIAHLKLPTIGIVSRNLELLSSITEALGLYELYPFKISNVIKSLSCLRLYPTNVCYIDFYINYGLVHSDYLSPDKIAVIGSHIPAGTSNLNFQHFIQNYSSKRFQRFDYGSKKNLKVYSSKQPPLYNVELVTAPVSIIASEIDWYSTNDDVQKLKSKLPNIKRFIALNSSLEFSHLEFVYGTRVQKIVNERVINILLDDLNMR